MASLYTAYFDESGTHTDSDAVVVAGFVSNATEWEAFSEKWRGVLANLGLAYFHMSEFEFAMGQFSDLSKEARQNLLNRLLSLINKHTFWSIGCVVERRSFDSIVSRVARKICGDAYGMAAIACWRHFGQFLKQNDAWMDCTMEAGARGAGALQRVFAEDIQFPEWANDHRILRLSFGNRQSFAPLQASDILAYELYKHWARQSGRETRGERYPIKVLAEKKHKWVYFDDKGLKEFDDDINEQLAQMRQRPRTAL